METKKLLTRKETAEYLGVKPQTLATDRPGKGTVRTAKGHYQKRAIAALRCCWRWGRLLLQIGVLAATLLHHVVGIGKTVVEFGLRAPQTTTIINVFPMSNAIPDATDAGEDEAERSRLLAIEGLWVECPHGTAGQWIVH